MFKILYLANIINDVTQIDKIVSVVDMESLIINVIVLISVVLYGEIIVYPVDIIIVTIAMCQYLLVIMGNRSKLEIVIIVSSIYLSL